MRQEGQKAKNSPKSEKNVNNEEKQHANRNTINNFLSADTNAFYLRLRENIGNTKIPIVVNGTGLSEEDKRNLESQIQELVSSEYAKYMQSSLESVKRIDDLTAIPDMNRKIEVSLEGLNLPHETKQRLESQIQESVSTELTKKGKEVPEGVRIANV